MEEEEETQQPFTRPHRRTAHVTTTTTTTVAAADKFSLHEGREAEGYDPLSILSKPAGYFIGVVAAQVDFLSGLVSESEALNVTPSRFLGRIARGLFGAGYAIAVLLAALMVAFLLGVGIVRMWLEEPMFLRRPLHFDYTQLEPAAEVPFGRRKGRAVPAGHTAAVCLELVMPESDYNRHIGMFQVTAEVISANGDVTASASQPCMLRFRSLPVRLMRTFIMGVPLLAGISSESQKIQIEILRYKESYQSVTEGIRIRMQARAGTTYLPQIYAAEFILSSKLPRRKELVYNWKWTFYVWVSLYVYLMFLILLACRYKPLVFLHAQQGYEVKEAAEVSRVEGQYSSDALRRWRERSRSKRKVSLPRMQPSEVVEGSASCATGGETSEVIDDYGDFAASESSECIGA